MTPTTPQQDKRSLLRIEAHPRSYDTLDQSQQRAFTECIRRLGGALDHLDGASKPEKPDPRVGFALEDERRAETFFLSAGRGMGKTTLMLSLMRATTHPQEPLPEDGELSRLVSRLRNRLVWLQPLEMETLPRETNLLPAILARIEEAIERVGIRPRGLAPDDDVEELRDGLIDERDDVLLELRRFQADVAIGWDGNLQARSGRMDSDPYATEVLRREKGKLKLRDRFADLLERLADRSISRWVNRPLFVLPVDDFDLDPSRCAEVLRLLHMLSSPRLISLVVGDVRVAETLVNFSVSRDLSQTMGAGPLVPARMLDEARSLAGEIASNMMRKLLPPMHRIELHPMAIAESLKYAPKGSADSDTLDALLARIPVRLEEPPPHAGGGDSTWLQSTISLRDHLLVEKTLVSQGVATGDSVRKKYSYQALEVLAGPPRRIADLWLLLKTVDDAVPETPAMLDAAIKAEDKRVETIKTRLLEKRALFIDHLIHAIKRLIAEEPWLGADDRQTLLDMFRQRTLGGEWESDLSALEVTWTGRKQVIQGTPATLGIKVDKRRSLRLKRRPRTGSPVASADAHNASAPGGLFDRTLTPATEGALTIIHDIFSVTPEAGTLVGRSRVPRQLKVAWARWRNRAGKNVRIYWPSPRFDSFWGLDLFLGVWESAASRALSLTTGTIEYLSYCWISAATTSLTDGTPNPIPAPVIPLPWHELVQRTVALCTGRANSEDRVRDSIVRLACLLAPECGLPGTVAEEFLKDKALTNLWEQPTFAESVRRERARRAAHLLSRQAEETAVRLILPFYFEEAVQKRHADPNDVGLANWTNEVFQMKGRPLSSVLRRDLQEAAPFLTAVQEGARRHINELGGGVLCPKETEISILRHRLDHDRVRFRLIWDAERERTD